MVAVTDPGILNSGDPLYINL